MATIRKVKRNHIQLQTELGTIDIETSLSDQNHIHIQTELATIDIRTNIKDPKRGRLESVQIQPTPNAVIEGDTMVLLVKKE